MTVRYTQGKLDERVSQILAPSVEWLCRKSRNWDNIIFSYIILAIGVTTMVSGDVAFYFTDHGGFGRLMDLATTGFWLLWWSSRIKMLGRLHAVLERILTAGVSLADAGLLKAWVNWRAFYVIFGSVSFVSDLALRHWKGTVCQAGFCIMGIALFWATTFVGPGRPARQTQTSLIPLPTQG